MERVTCPADGLRAVSASSTHPGNDTFSGATAITSIPFSTTEDTTQATFDSADSAAVIDVAQLGGGGGGTLSLALNALADPISAFAIDSSGSFDKSTGAATVTGTITCSPGAFAFGSGQINTDAHGRNASIGSIPFFGYAVGGLTCDGTSHQWSLTVTPPSGQFKGGPVTASLNVGASGLLCGSRQLTQTVTLKAVGPERASSDEDLQQRPEVLTRRADRVRGVRRRSAHVRCLTAWLGRGSTQ